jgi:hypothetical protein
LKSAVTERQLLEVLARPHIAALIDPAAAEWMRQLMAAAEAVTITQRIAACRDATDDKRPPGLVLPRNGSLTAAAIALSLACGITLRRSPHRASMLI